MADAIGASERPGANLRPGTLLAERYRIESIVGAGAFGVVWRARHVHLETECAVKLFDPPVGADPQDASARFLQEARLTARLKCPHVAQVFDYGVHEKMPFLVLELLRGASLAGHLDARREHGRRLPPGEVARIIRHVSEALSVAHAARVVHRDLKPENIFLVEEGESHVAKVLDFGIAKWSADAAPSMTTTRMVMGTAHYMSPEQFESARHVDHRTDLWSLGVIAFECLTGQVPFPGGSFIDVAFRVCKEGPLVASQIAAVPAGFDAWFARATALGREYRFASAQEQAEALERVCAAPPAPAARLESSAPQPLTAREQVTTTRTLVTARAAELVALFRSAQRALSLMSTRRQAWEAWWSVGDQPGASGGVISLRGRRFWIGGACVLGLSVAWLVALAGSDPVALDLEQETLSAQPSSLSKERPRANTPPRDERPVAPQAPAVPAASAHAPSARGPGMHPTNDTGLDPAPPAVAGSEPAPAGSAGAQGSRGTSLPSPAARESTGEQRAESNGGTPGAGGSSAPVPKQERPAHATRSTAPLQRSALKAPKKGAADSHADFRIVPESAQTGTFDRKAAMLALREQARLVRTCTSAGGPTGSGRVEVKYEPSGQVADVSLPSNFQNTGTGRCVQLMFRGAKVSEFTGAPYVVANTTFEVPAQAADTARGSSGTAKALGEGSPQVGTSGVQQGSDRSLPVEVIRREVELRGNYDLLRFCYRGGLARSPNLQGQVNVRFQVGRYGAVSEVEDAGSNLPDPDVIACVRKAFSRMSFSNPDPEGKPVPAHYSVQFGPD